MNVELYRKITQVQDGLYKIEYGEVTRQEVTSIYSLDDNDNEENVINAGHITKKKGQRYDKYVHVYSAFICKFFIDV